tara:strand:- start:3119 stop:3475 length:357 start_codon:yes stop_codon:yes gene_type:complete
MQLTETEIYEIIKEEVKNFLDETIETVKETEYGTDDGNSLTRPATSFSRNAPWTDPSGGWIDPDTGEYVEGDPSGATAPGRSTRMRKVAVTKAKRNRKNLHGADVALARKRANKSYTA